MDDPSLTQAPAIDGSPATWMQSLRKALRSGRELLEILSLPPDLACPAAERDFPVFVPLEYVRRMQPGKPDDPLLLQVLGSRLETGQSTGGLLDPVGDRKAEVIPGLLQKYQARALLITSAACAVHCRYCFRRHYPYQDAPTGPIGWQAAIDRIRADDSLEEIILSGGDPLSVRDSSLGILIRSLDAIPHVRRIRLHTRFPVMIPQRVCTSLLDWLSDARCAVFFVLHFNHAAEVDPDVHQAMRRLRRAGATLLNQSVLLKGVNDSVEAQYDLCRTLLDMHVLPYYLHQLDPVRGGLHFAVDDREAHRLMNELRRILPGYGVPRLVREEIGQPYKVPLLEPLSPAAWGRDGERYE